MLLFVNRINNLMSILSKYDLFIFDWDHTLTKSTLLLTLMALTVRKARSGRIERSIEKRRDARVSEKAIRNIKIDESFSKLYSYFDDIYSFIFRPRLKDNAADLLELLKKRRKKVAVFSDSKTYRLLKETSMLGVLRYVDFALSAESIGYYKPDPTGLLVLVDKFGVSKKRCLYIGDLPTDILTARLAGIDSCGVADGIGKFDSLKKANPNYLFTHMDSLFQNLRKRR